MVLGCLFSLLLFGAVHCVAWNFEFPTELEMIFWRLSSIVTAVVLPVTWLLGQVLDPIWG
jgi:hypothetical protein